MPAPSQRPEEARIAAKDRENERLRRERDEARAAVAAAQAATASSVAPPSEPQQHGISDEALGRLTRETARAVARKVGLPAAFIAMLGGGGYAIKASRDRPAPPPLTAAQLDERLEKFETKVVGRLDTLTITTNGVIDLQRCMRKKTDQIGGSLLPAPDRLGSALKQSPYDDDCSDSPKRLPEPKQ